ncbi:MAG TPA: putative peptidoglycan glycosyltransferase FtsW [bacterium]|nr:putative peptidoglycan glycosyltransferase FtsW [bacterium]HPR86859.1 putative peptidoglycan glycosyltransferase FtsW [bacterium]
MIEARKKMDWARTDFALLTCILVLIILGAATIYSASSYRSEMRYGDSAYFFTKQLARIVIGLMLMVWIARRDYHEWLGFAWPLFWISLVLLAILLLHIPFITPRNGARSWINLYFFSFQPSDFARYALITVLAIKLHEWREHLDDPAVYIQLFGLALLIVGPIALEHDMGTAALTMITVFSLFFIAEIRVSYLAATALSAVSLALLYASFNKYMLIRITDHLHSVGGEMHPHLKQSIIALVQGGIFGMGIGGSRQKYLFLPEAHNDFIYAMIGEEYGLIGTIGVLLLFLMIIHRGLIIARQAPDATGRYLAGGITACYASYALINAGVVIGLLPTTGIPMPFLSYGGTSLVTHLCALGLLLNISAQGSPAYAKSPGWREYRQRVSERAFPEPSRLFAGRPRMRKTVSLRRSVR